FCGAVGLCSPLAGLELGVAIRTLELRGRRLWIGAGGGVVSDSSPDGELREAVAKAAGAAGAAGLAVDPGDGWSPERVPAAAERAGASPHGPVAPITALPRPEPERGVFETIRVRDGRAVAAAAHLARLSRSCAALRIQLPGDLEQLVADAAAQLGDGGVQVLVGGGGELELATRAAPAPSAVRLEPVIVPGGLGPHKWRDRALIDALSGPGSTPLICDLDGEVLEAGYASVLLMERGGLTAAPVDRRRLDSVSRALVLAA